MSPPSTSTRCSVSSSLHRTDTESQPDSHPPVPGAACPAAYTGQTHSHNQTAIHQYQVQRVQQPTRDRHTVTIRQPSTSTRSSVSSSLHRTHSHNQTAIRQYQVQRVQQPTPDRQSQSDSHPPVPGAACPAAYTGHTVTIGQPSTSTRCSVSSSLHRTDTESQSTETSRVHEAVPGTYEYMRPCQGLTST